MASLTTLQKFINIISPYIADVKQVLAHRIDLPHSSYRYPGDYKIDPVLENNLKIMAGLISDNITLHELIRLDINKNFYNYKVYDELKEYILGNVIPRLEEHFRKEFREKYPGKDPWYHKEYKALTDMSSLGLDAIIIYNRIAECELIYKQVTKDHMESFMTGYEYRSSCPKGPVGR